ncbi:hypothetical protein [Tellurirhabdus rosea]|uniref:hypothetical protein n=1 Tax=Tellurirhabdus rosea TaxID=2674997 RepID=UPI002257730B|nr:hypothetical protein [Tellurirhabdus rosea]
MKKLFTLTLLLTSLWAAAQTSDNTVSAKIDGKEWKAKAQRLNLPFTGVKYLAIAGMAVNPDVETWIRFIFTDKLTPGTYQIVSEDEKYWENKANYKNGGVVWALVDYSEETKGLGHAFRDGESLKGTITITKVTDTSIEGTFEATLKVVTYKKRALDTVTGFGLRRNLEEKAITAAGGGMLTKSGPHDHENTRRTETKEEMVISSGAFNVNWSSGATAQRK